MIATIDRQNTVQKLPLNCYRGPDYDKYHIPYYSLHAVRFEKCLKIVDLHIQQILAPSLLARPQSTSRQNYFASLALYTLKSEERKKFKNKINLFLYSNVVTPYPRPPLLDNI